MSHYALSGIVPLAVISRLADTISEEMDCKESLKGFPRDNNILFNSASPDRNSRRLLERMRLVCRAWDELAQHVLRRRLYVDIKDRKELDRFMGSPKCGPWVRELQLWDVCMSKRSTWMTASLSDLFQKLPSLAALSILASTKFDRLRIISPSISSLSHLRTLHIQCSLDAHSLCVFYEVVAHLRSLEVLSVIGFWLDENNGDDDDGYYDDDDDDDDADGNDGDEDNDDNDGDEDNEEEKVADESDNVNIRSQNITSNLPRSHPPASLRKLLYRIVICEETVPSSELLSWLLQARGDFALHELRLILASEHRVRVPNLLSSFTNTLPFLKTLVLGNTVAFPDDGIGALLDKCTALQNLHLYAAPKYTLPASLEHFCWGHDTYELFRGTIADDILSQYLRIQLVSGKAPNLRSVQFEAKRQGLTLHQTRKVCEEFGIKFDPHCRLEGTWSFF